MKFEEVLPAYLDGGCILRMGTTDGGDVYKCMYYGLPIHRIPMEHQKETDWYIYESPDLPEEECVEPVDSDDDPKKIEKLYVQEAEMIIDNGRPAFVAVEEKLNEIIDWINKHE